MGVQAGPHTPNKRESTPMGLTIAEVKNAKPGKLFDGNGMFLLARPDGAKCWRLKYRFAGKEKLLALGVYPEVSLADARAKRDDARKQLRDGIDPSERRRAERRTSQMRSENTFEAIGREWWEAQKDGWSEV